MEGSANRSRRACKEMQIAAEEPVAFDTLVKDNALKLLLDYSSSTGKKWEAIRKEILSVAEADFTENAPILTRQNLEGWAARRGELGDDKFKWVYRFLTHRDTLARPEFKDAHRLMQTNFVLLSVGRVLHEVHGSPLFSFSEEQLDQVCGLYTLEHEMMPSYALYLVRPSREQFLVAHFLTRWNRKTEEGDWDVFRRSGFATFGNNKLLHAKYVDGSLSSLMYFKTIKNNIGDFDQIRIIWHDLNSQLLMYDKDPPDELFRNPLDETHLLSRSDTSIFSDIIDNIKWSVPL